MPLSEIITLCPLIQVPWWDRLPQRATGGIKEILRSKTGAPAGETPPPPPIHYSKLELTA